MLRAPILAMLALCFSLPAAAQDREVPYWATLRSDEVNMRVGPSEDYQILWVYHREGLPVKVVRLKEGWRLIRDSDGAEGWVVARLLNPARSALVIGSGPVAMRDDASDDGALRWKLAPGVVGKLGKCEVGWCQLDVQGRKGWVKANRLWGAGEP